MTDSTANLAKAPVALPDDKDATVDDIAAPPETVQMTDEEELGAAADKDQTESGKLRMLLGVLKRMIGVKDMAAIRLSLPANLLEPIPNLEYWNYLDRGDLFTRVADFDDPLERMLAVLRFTFTKDLKFVRGKICKPYNSVLGEHFRCHWDIEPAKLTDTYLLPVQALATENPEPLPLAAPEAKTPSFAASKGSTPPSPLVQPQDTQKSRPPSIKGVALENNIAKKGLAKLLGRKKGGKDSSDTCGSVAPSSASVETANSYNSDTKAQQRDKRRLCYITEQVSHHPPISSFFCESKDAGIQLYGVDQVGAKFTGTSVKIFPGEKNQGFFLRLTEGAKCQAIGEEYQITHPTASINGLLRGSLWIAVSGSSYITCRGGKRHMADYDDGTRLRAIVEYKDESWITKAKYAVEGAIYEIGPTDDPEEYTQVKLIPQDRILATFEGSWKGKITYKKKGDKESHLLLNLHDLEPIDKSVRPLESQEEMESRKVWEPVTNAILSKKYSEATKSKQEVEQRQRTVAAERKSRGEIFVPRFFDPDISDGRPKLTEAGKRALDGEYNLEGYNAADTTPDTTAPLSAKKEDNDDDDDFQDAEN